MKNSINISVELSDDYLIITKSEYYSLLDNKNLPTKTWWSMDDLMNESNESRKWIKDNLIKDEEVWKEIESFTHLPKHNNDEYRFVGTKMKRFLEDNFKKLKG
ncbi:DUF771 domain-containing protein [Staphylococcus kloosii]|jgi:phage pi2 protein 07|uniref:DUF771 domain-containing protein n=1 Tax=Staphylococcus kloosii TaxID=29384 RepID=UPI00189F44B0|nr:DUF771 domain-containing protein [Staphylococcus kloosii]MBF7022534.1 DUF771 domain-containing protein [Staphylococcus kloosii]MCD8878240.1 DUF771 domain-containing protein [Staphylococcus kloosii]